MPSYLLIIFLFSNSLAASEQSPECNLEGHPNKNLPKIMVPFSSKLYSYSEKRTCSPQLLEEVYKKKKSVYEILGKIINNNIKVVSIGEIHTFSAGQYGYSQLFEQLKLAGFTFDCITLELTEDRQYIIKNVLAGKKVSEKEFRNAVDVVSGNQYFSTVNYAKEYGVNIQSVDLGYGWPTIKKLYSLGDLEKLKEIRSIKYSVEDRNDYMGKKISDLLSSKECKKIIHIGGMSHLSSIKEPNRTIKSVLSSKGINSVNIAIEPTTDLYYWNDFIPTALRCTEGQEPLNQNKAFGLIPSDANNFLVHKLSQPINLDHLVLWNDLDSILFLPGKTKPLD